MFAVSSHSGGHRKCQLFSVAFFDCLLPGQKRVHSMAGLGEILLDGGPELLGGRSRVGLEHVHFHKCHCSLVGVAVGVAA